MNFCQKKTSNIFICLICLIIFERCNSNLDFNYSTQVSLSINESKQGNVFLSQYKIEKIKLYNNTISFPIKEVWAEKNWNMTLDSAGKEVREINTSSPPNLVFLLIKNDSLNEGNYMKKWMLSDTDTSSSAITNGRIYMSLNEHNVPGSLQLSIYKLSETFNYKKKLERVADFSLKREE